MIVSARMDLEYLKSRMLQNPAAVTDAQAEGMRSILVASFDGWETAHLPGACWHEMTFRALNSH